MSTLKNDLIKKMQDMKLKKACAQKMLSFSVEIMKGVYRNYINHDKVIAWRNGCPVFSTLSPPALSIVQANMEAKNAIARMQNRNFPNMINIGITDDCNCDCVHCSFKSIKNDSKRVLNTEEMKEVISSSQALGVSTITLSGGEPLINKDIIKLIEYVDKRLSVVVLFTNGWYLKDKAKELKKSGLYSVSVSIDSNVPEKHDALRKKEGLFKRAIAGIKAAKDADLLVAISTCVTKEQVENGELEKIIELGKKLNVDEIIVFNNIPTGKLMNKKELLGKQEWTKKIIKISKKYNSKYDYPGIYVYSHVNSFRGLGCAGGATFFYVSPYGNVHPCDFNPYYVGNVLQTPLHQLWDKLNNTEGFTCTSFNGCKMQDLAYRKILKKFKKD